MPSLYTCYMNHGIHNRAITRMRVERILSWAESTLHDDAAYALSMIHSLWGVERTLAVIGTGGPVSRLNAQVCRTLLALLRAD
eukprot:3540380-Pyramimonas_sp.AAC.2